MKANPGCPVPTDPIVPSRPLRAGDRIAGFGGADFSTIDRIWTLTTDPVETPVGSHYYECDADLWQYRPDLGGWREFRVTRLSLPRSVASGRGWSDVNVYLAPIPEGGGAQ